MPPLKNARDIQTHTQYSISSNKTYCSHRHKTYTQYRSYKLQAYRSYKLKNKKLCYGRGTARRDALVSIEKKVCNDLNIHPMSLQLLLLNAVWHITSCLWTVVSTSLSRTVFKTLPLLKRT